MADVLEQTQWEEPDAAIVPEEPTETDLVVFKQRAMQINVINDISLKSAAVFVEQCKLSAKRVEEKRMAQVKPLNDQVDAINKILIPVRDAFKALARMVDERAGKFIADRRRQAEEEQRRLNAEAAAKQAELDRKAEEERQKAAVAAASGDVKGAVKAESNALKLEQKAAATVAPVVPQVSNKLDLGDSSLSFKAPKKEWNLPGWDRKKPLPLTDPLLAPLLGDTNNLPEGVRFLLKYGDLNPVRINAAYKSGERFPKPFGESESYGGSTLRTE